ncbi:MAG: thioesterase family protein [Pseudomonadota bacterium]
MNLYWRLLLVWLRNLSGDQRHYTHAGQSRFRVLPHDLDAFGHMNNGRYLQIMDVARVEWMLQTGVLAAIRRHRWSPLLGGGFIRYRYSLRLLQSFHVQTRLLGWDTRWFYLEHNFTDNHNRCVAIGITRAGLRDGAQWVDTHAVADMVHPGAQSPDIPEHVHDWISVEQAMFKHGTAAQPAPTQTHDLGVER